MTMESGAGLDPERSNLDSCEPTRTRVAIGHPSNHMAVERRLAESSLPNQRYGFQIRKIADICLKHLAPNACSGTIATQGIS
jgi:hypothetical protein